MTFNTIFVKVVKNVFKEGVRVWDFVWQQAAMAGLRNKQREEEMKEQKEGLKARQPFVPEQDPRGFYWWPINLIAPNEDQPRQYFAEESMTGLRDSIARLGILKPLTIKPRDEFGNALLVDGERRFRCAQQLEKEKVPVFLAAKDDQDIFRTSVVLNFCREDMTEIEIARALEYLIDKYGYSQTEVAKLIGKSQGWVSQKLKYLRLHPEVAALLAVRKIAPSIALAVAVYPLDKQERLIQLLEKEVKDKGAPLTPQEASLLVRKHGERVAAKPQRKRPGRQYLPFAGRLVASLTKRSAKLSAELEKLEDVDLQNVGGEDLLALEREIKKIRASGKRVLEILRIFL